MTIVSGLISLGTKGNTGKTAILFGGMLGLVLFVIWIAFVELYYTSFAMIPLFFKIGVEAYIAMIGSIVLLASALTEQ